MLIEPIRFFLECDRKARHFYAVEFYPTPSAMHEAIAILRGSIDPEDRKARAMCLRYIAEKRDSRNRLRTTGELGTIFFVKGDAKPDVVVHELTHAAVGWAKRTRTNPLKRSKSYSKCPEENFARTLQFMFWQFYQKAPKALGVAA